MFKTRLLSGIVLVIIAVASIAAGGPVLFGVLLAISLIGVYELYKAMGVHQKGIYPIGNGRLYWNGALLSDPIVDSIA